MGIIDEIRGRRTTNNPRADQVGYRQSVVGAVWQTVAQVLDQLLESVAVGYARWDSANKRLSMTQGATFPPTTTTMLSFKMGASDFYFANVFDDSGYLPYSFDRNGFFAQSGHNTVATHVLQNVVDFGSIVNGIGLGHWAAKGPNSLGNYQTYAYALVNATDVSAAGMDSTYTIGVMKDVVDNNTGQFLQPNIFYTFRGDAFILPVGTSIEGANGNLLTLGNYIVRGIVIQGVVNSASADINFVNGSMNAWTDESGGTKFLKFKVKCSDGVIRTGSVTLA